MDSATEKVLEDQAAAQDYDGESSFEVISDSDDPVSSETDHFPPAKPVDETPAPALMPDLGNEASSSIIVLSGSGSASKNVLSATVELEAETTAPAPTAHTETGYAASSSLVAFAGSGSAANNVQAASSDLVGETTAPAPRLDLKTGNAASSSLDVLEGSGSAAIHFQEEKSVIGQSDEEYRERDQSGAEKFSAHNSFEREREINNLIPKAEFNNDPYNRDFSVTPELLFRRYLSCPELYNHSDSDDSDCSIDIIDDQNEVKPNNVTYFSDFNSNCSILF